jgi:predicted negative regulator of RcsB-dependent stress response
VTTHYDDEAQVEELRRWWKENWIALAAGLALGLSAIFGWQAYAGHRDGQRQQAARMLGDLKTALTAEKVNDAQAIGKRLVEDFANTPYAADAQLRLAGAAVDSGKLEEAQSRLQWIVEYEQQSGLFDGLSRLIDVPALGSGRDSAMLGLARLRLAQVLWQAGKSDDALALLAKNDADEKQNSYKTLGAELRGDILLMRGDRAGARAAYQAAVQAADAAGSTGPKAGPILQQKLDSLADVAASS